ncbi:LpxI family protein [Candidatus Viadribacter manganicus]|uniref:UDP-2,3-diacylglucosamine pyrophosphatase n=1 Tax=Candidatus Viadribacter manganicus TaxID=1759059 RepID=A0A1B1ADB0_9PROT|nr:UDP-2,3-diacylglucosamine diphosphatase LpxI [Candidatus Viadribacter manganicus]ANP44547.1 UDP-2,3-diacylglucosamine pyrophosphatase [Candidatus Viadribacter manganicus]
MSGWRKLGVIAGGGELPVVLAEHLAGTQRPYFVARVAPNADPALDAHPGATHGLGQMGARMDAMREAGCDAVVLLGQVQRPDLKTLQLDDVAISMLPAILAAMPKGDDALLRAVLNEHEKAGFTVLGADQVMSDLLATPGVWGAIAPNEQQKKEIAKAAKVAAASGAFDIGQGVVVCDGLVLAVEAQEGTDAMLRRVAELPTAIRGTPQARRGVLVKRPKPIQERRIDLPTIGVRTIEGAAGAGLAGIAVEAQGALAVRRDEIITAANRAGIFVYGFTANEVDAA